MPRKKKNIGQLAEAPLEETFKQQMMMEEAIASAELAGANTEEEKKDIAEVESWTTEDLPLKIKGTVDLEEAKKWVGSTGDGTIAKPWEKWNKPKEQINEIGVEAQTENKPDVELVLLNGKHFYKTNDENTPYYVSVTTILSALAKGKGFDIWQSTHTREEQQDILDETSLRGSKVHYAIQLLIQGANIIPEEFEYIDDEGKRHRGLSTEERNMVNSFVRWWYEFKPKVLASEKIVYNTTYKFAGTLDFIGTIREGLLDKKSKSPNREVLFILDYKTSSGIWPSYEMQVAAYAASEQQISGKKVERGAILRLGTKHKCGYEFKFVDSLSESYKAFLGVLAAWRYQNPDFQPKFIELPKSFKLPPIEMVAEEKKDETTHQNQEPQAEEVPIKSQDNQEPNN